jgi:hypothetical protein
MTTYLVECYWPGVDAQLLADAVERLAGSQQTRSDTVAWISSILVPEDEIVLCLAGGSSAEAVRTSARRAGLPAERIVECVYVAPHAFQDEEQPALRSQTREQ